MENKHVRGVKRASDTLVPRAPRAERTAQRVCARSAELAAAAAAVADARFDLAMSTPAHAGDRWMHLQRMKTAHTWLVETTDYEHKNASARRDALRVLVSEWLNGRLCTVTVALRPGQDEPGLHVDDGMASPDSNHVFTVDLDGRIAWVGDNDVLFNIVSVHPDHWPAPPAPRQRRGWDA